MNATTTVSIADNAIENIEALRNEIIPALQPHPVPQSDSRTKGLIFQFKKETVQTSLQHFPFLYDFINPRLHEGSEYILGVNQTPPSCYDDFAMRPHIDRKWENTAFDSQAPLFTTVVFLDFSPTAKGGELLIFENCNEFQVQYLESIDRKDARYQLNDFQPLIVEPVPGRICTFPGHLPHAVLGYSASENEKWRLSLILAEFN